MWITHSLCSYVWKRQRQRNECCITAPEPLKHRPDSPKHYSTTPHLSHSFQRSEIQTRSLKDHSYPALVSWGLKPPIWDTVGASQKLFRRLMISFVCAAELLSVCARYIRIINNLNTFYWLGFLCWGEIHLLVKNSLRESDSRDLISFCFKQTEQIQRQTRHNSNHASCAFIRSEKKIHLQFSKVLNIFCKLKKYLLKTSLILNS